MEHSSRKGPGEELWKLEHNQNVVGTNLGMKTQDSYLSGIQEEQDTAGAVKKQEVRPTNGKVSVCSKQLSGY